MNHPDDQGPTDPDPTGPHPGEQLGPYVVDAFVARGGMASVYAATDTRSGASVALKLLRPLDDDPRSRGRFRREFRALSRLDHPNVLRVYEWGLRGDRPWFSMELVPGRDLRDEVTQWGELSPSERFGRVQGALVQIARALEYLHERGMVHRDLTPGNVMIRPDGTVKLMDFGVVRELGSDLTGVHEVMGTAAWIAPEQIEGTNVDARADLYSLGAVLYYMLTGRRPFTARSLAGYLEKHLSEPVRPPRVVDPGVPAHLDAICVRLLQKEPSDRFASAAHLLHVLGDHDPDEDAEHWPPRMVGRTVVRARIRAAIASLEAGIGGAAILVQAGPGQGKTRVLDTAESQARRHGLRVVRARARAEAGPFAAFVDILEGLDLGDNEVPPVIRAALLGEGERPQERYPVLAAFKPLLSSRAPLVVIVDDLHDADGASLDLLEYLVRNTLELASEPVLFIVSEELHGADRTPIEERLSGTGVVHVERLGPLERAEVEELVLSLVPQQDGARALAWRLHEESDGSPAYLVDMLRGLTDEGLLVRGDSGWEIALDPGEITLSRLPMPASLRQALQERLAPLSAAAMEVGRSLAVARRQLDLPVLLAITPMDDDDVIEGLDELVEAGIAQDIHSEAGERVDLSHQRFREVLLDGLDPTDLKRRHQRCGEELERHHRARPAIVAEELTWHFEQAGIATKAYAYLVRTARRRLDASLWEEAFAFLDRALTMEPTARPLMLLDDADRRLARVRLGRSQCLQALGQWKRAAIEAREAVRLADDVADPLLQSTVLVEAGRQMRQRGEAVQAESTLRKALDRAEAAHDPALRTSPLYELGGLAWTRGDLGSAERCWKDSLETAQRVGDDRGVAYGFNGLGILAICTGQTMEARRHLEQSAEIFDRLGMLAPLSIAWMNLAEVYQSAGLLKKTLAVADRTIARAREVNHALGIALGLAHRAGVLAELGRLDEALTNAREAVRLTAEVSAGEDEVQARATLGRIRLQAGDAEGALRALESLSPLLDGYDTEGIAPMTAAWRATALARLDRDEEALQALSTCGDAPHVWPHVRVPTDLAVAEALIALGHRDAARERYQRALHTAEASGYRLYQLHAHHGLARVVRDESTQARHARVAAALARSLAANLARTDATGFLARGWGSR